VRYDTYNDADVTRLRPFLGPAIVGVSAWCAAGHLTVASADSPLVRLGVGASPAVFLIAIALAFCVPAWRRDWRLAAPAILAVLPWLPLPLPAIALMWTGPLAWAPILCACALAAIDLAPAIRSLVASRGATAATLATLLVVSAAAWQAAPQYPQGDEPHYLVTTQSLLNDGDLRVENNFRQRDYAPYYAGTLVPDFDRRGKDGAIYSIHPIAVSIVVLPGFALFGYRGAEITLLILAALTGGLVWRIGFRITGQTPAAWFAWAAIVLAPVFVFHSFALFPEALGAGAFAACALLLVRLAQHDARVSAWTLVGASVCLAAFPWLHSRFAILAAAFGLATIWYLLRDSSRPMTGRLSRVAWFAIVPAVSAVGWLAFFYALYGTADPRGAHGVIDLHVDRMRRGVLGMLFDEQYGLLAYTPVLAAAVVGLFRPVDRASRALAWLLWAIALACITAAVSYRMDEMWWAGLPSAPARYGVAVLPAFAIPIAAAWARAGAGARRAWIALLLVSVATTVLLLSVDRGAIAWNWRDAQARWLEWLAPLVNLPRGWPSYFWPFPAMTPFVVHVLLWIAIPSACWLALAAIAQRRAWSAAALRAGSSWWVAVSLMAAVQAGWWINGSTGLDPARSQFATLTAMARGGALFTIAPFRLARDAGAVGTMHIRPEEPKLYDPRPVLARFSGIPAGRYTLHLALTTPAEGDITAKSDRAFRLDRMLHIDGGVQASAALDLAGGAGGLALIADAALQPVVSVVDIVPSVVFRPGPPQDQPGLRSGSAEVFFPTNRVYLEPSGFWLRGRETTPLLLSALADERVIRLFVRNGGVMPNLLTIDAGSYQRQFSFDLNEERVIELPVIDGSGVLAIRAMTTEGFRPSDTKTSSDDRLLGLWCEVR